MSPVTKMSLRARLLIATVSLVALGLLVADAATFTLLRSSLVSRIDQQLDGARFYATRELFNHEGPGFSGMGPGGGPPATGDAALPVTFVELLDASGNTVASRTFGFGSAESSPELPAGLPGSHSQSDGKPTRTFTAPATGGASLRYRVLATALGGPGGTIVVAFPMRDVDATLGKLLLVEALVTGFVLAVVVALALWLVRLGLRPLSQMEQAAGAIAGGDLSLRVEPADSKTEVGRLGLALNAMLEKIEAAFAERTASEDRLRRFVADASHELRTPLTSIRGYAELFRRGAGSRPEDLEKSMRRIEQESVRMGTLVEELLLLARLDEGLPAEKKPVDLAAVAVDAVEDARAVDPERSIEVVASEPVIVEGDCHRLRQVAANLMSNALEHTPPGTPVSVRVRELEGAAILEVSDQGPGLAPEAASKVFNRFFRVDPARSRLKGGAGLGLSIVSSITEAHGGKASVETSPGQGARFVVEIPLRGKKAEPQEAELKEKAAELSEAAGFEHHQE